MVTANNKIHTPVSRLMTTAFVAVEPWDTLGEAVERMSEKEAGSALVVDYGRLVGILTSRDILRAVAGRTHSSEARVREWMSGDPRVALADTPAEEAALAASRAAEACCFRWTVTRFPTTSVRSSSCWATGGSAAASSISATASTCRPRGSPSRRLPAKTGTGVGEPRGGKT